MPSLAKAEVRAVRAIRQGTLPALPQRQAAWVASQVAIALPLALTGVWAWNPELSLALTMAAVPVAAVPRKWWALPLSGAAVAGASLACEWIGVMPVVGAAAVAGAMTVWLLPDPSDWLDSLNAALGSIVGAAIGLFAAAGFGPALTSSLLGAVLTASLVGLVASQGLIPAAIRMDRDRIPTLRDIKRALRLPYRPPVLRALDLFKGCATQAPDPETRRGLAEVASWIFRLQSTLQTLDDELGTIEPGKIEERIRQCEDDAETDPFTRERRAATAQHLKRLLEHRAVIGIERGRTDALVEYATAFLEEARAGLAVARELPGEAIPDRLPEVLGRLRNHADEGDVRRKTSRDMGQFQV